jgi:ribosomal-protein-alanine N-acetyltransferase
MAPELTILETANLTLRQFLPEHLVALIEAPEDFEAISGFPAAQGLRDFFVSGEVDPAWLAKLKTVQDSEPWSFGFAAIDKATMSIIGSGGFKGRPDDEDGVVEIAYGVVPSFEGRGYATEIATALTHFCFDHGAKQVRAHTLPVPNASNHILLKCGFRFSGEVMDPADGLVWRYERDSTSNSVD